MSIKEIDRVLPVTRGESVRTRERRSVVKPKRWKRYEPLIIGTVAVTSFLSAWQVFATLNQTAKWMPALFLPSPSDVADAFVKLFSVPSKSRYAKLLWSWF